MSGKTNCKPIWFNVHSVSLCTTHPAFLKVSSVSQPPHAARSYKNFTAGFLARCEHQHTCTRFSTAP